MKMEIKILHLEKHFKARFLFLYLSVVCDYCPAQEPSIESSSILVFQLQQGKVWLVYITPPTNPQ